MMFEQSFIVRWGGSFSIDASKSAPYSRQPPHCSNLILALLGLAKPAKQTGIHQATGGGCKLETTPNYLQCIVNNDCPTPRLTQLIMRADHPTGNVPTWGHVVRETWNYGKTNQYLYLYGHRFI